MNPTPRDVTIMMQKWISFMPISWARGSMIGARITIFGVVSMTQPAMIRMKIIIRMMTVSLSVIEVIAYTNPCGTSSAARVCANGKENAMIGTITPLTLAELANILGKSASVIVRWKSPMMIVVTTATAAASVGVKIPV